MAKKPQTVPIRDATIRPEYEANMKALLAAIEICLAEFGRHKGALLAILRDGYDRGVKSAPVDGDGTKPMPFEPDRAWDHLVSVASQYSHREWAKQRVTTAADRQARLRDTAKALRRARDMISEAMQSDVGNDLISAWWDTDPAPMRLLFGEDNALLDIVDLHIFDKAVALVAALEATALRAADDVPARRGRPKGTAILPWDFIATLAFIYRESTRSKPGAGEGPFARLCVEFLTALDRRNITDKSVFEAIQDTRVWAKNSKWSSSPFDD